MTINEYLGQAQRLKFIEDRAKERLERFESRVTDPKSCLNLGDGVLTENRIGSANRAEARMISYIDAGKQYITAHENYKQFRTQLQNAVSSLPHWAALIIERRYIYNVYFGYDDDLTGIDEILDTKSRKEILFKLNEAKLLLADHLRVQGVEIEEYNNE